MLEMKLDQIHIKNIKMNVNIPRFRGPQGRYNTDYFEDEWKAKGKKISNQGKEKQGTFLDKGEQIAGDKCMGGS